MMTPMQLRPVDRQTDRHIGRQTYKQIDRHRERWTLGHDDSYAGETDGQTDILMDKIIYIAD